MALVAYDDSSEDEISCDEEAPTNVHLNSACVNNSTSNLQTNFNDNQNRPLFSSLPIPTVSNNPEQEEEDDEFLHKKEVSVEKPVKRVQINIPSLSAYSSDEDEKPPDKRAKKSFSGLFAVLPPPKLTALSNTSFVPNIVQKKANKPTRGKPPQKKKPVQVETTKSSPAPVKISNVYHSDSNDEDDIEIPETFDDETWQKVCGKKKKTEVKHSPEDLMMPDPDTVSVIAAPEVEKPYSGLDNKAFKELVGSSKRIPQNIKLIDIHEDSIRPDKEVWLKSLTDPNFEAEAVIENPVDNTRKSKNHITALAQKALANDKELQLRWSENRFNRKQTQAKYGF